MFVFEANQRKLFCISIQFSNNKVRCFSVTKIFVYSTPLKRTEKDGCPARHCVARSVKPGVQVYLTSCKSKSKIFDKVFAEARVKAVLRYPHLIKKPPHQKGREVSRGTSMCLFIAHLCQKLCFQLSHFRLNVSGILFANFC